MADKRKWRKILYEDQGYPDNYVDKTFLEELQKNLYTRTYSYWTLCLQSGIISQQLSSVCLFLTSFMYMESKWLSAQLLVVFTSLVTLLFYLVNILLTKSTVHTNQPQRTYVDDVKTTVLFLGVSFVLSPVLVSLTETISTDTIYAMTAVMLLANLLFHDYMTKDSRVPGALSLSAAMFASVCLASRLHTTWHAFATVTFSFQLFALWPVLRHKLQLYLSWHGQVAMTVVTSSLTFCGLLSVSIVGAVLYTAALVFITFVCPACLSSLQPYKNNIYGPWDEAIVEEDEPIDR